MRALSLLGSRSCLATRRTSTRYARRTTMASTAAAAEAWCFPASARVAANVVERRSGVGDVDASDADAQTIPVVPVLCGDKDSAERALRALPEAGRRWVAATQGVGGGQFSPKSGEVLLVPSASTGAIDRALLGVDSATDVWGFAALATKLPAAAPSPASADDQPPPAASPMRYELDGAALAALDEAAAAASGGGDGQRAGVISSAADAALLGFMLGCYRFDRYKSSAASPADAAKSGDSSSGNLKAIPSRPQLVCPPGAQRERVEALARAFAFARDAINTPANDMGPQHLAAEAAALAAAHEGASCVVVEGDALLAEGYPAVHTVGRASSRPPALIDITWRPPGVSDGDAEALPLLSLVGKGVCFDTGGLNLKTAAGMRTMKKDMGGAALVLALSHWAMASRLPVRLRALVPAVENSVSGDAYRPLDVLRTRAGITVEQGNCDAEGRLILADAIYEAALSSPDLLIDAATLTGAARAALGPEVPAVFTPDDGAWRELEAASLRAGGGADPLWRMPLHSPYRRFLDSKVADIASVAGGDAGGQGGAIVAALFLREFAAAGYGRAAAASAAGERAGAGGAAADDDGGARSGGGRMPWVHIDTGAWVAGGMVKQGRPDGGEALGLMALAEMVDTRYRRRRDL